MTSSLWSYASTVGIDGQMSMLVDPLSVFMILVVSGVSTLIHLYSISYVDSDRGFARYFRSNVSLANLANFVTPVDPNAHQRDEFMLFKGEVDHRFGARPRIASEQCTGTRTVHELLAFSFRFSFRFWWSFCLSLFL